MSRAFVKENDLEHAGIDIPERPISKEPNYVTQHGYDDLKKSLEALEKEIKNLKQLEDSPENKQKKNETRTRSALFFKSYRVFYPCRAHKPIS